MIFRNSTVFVTRRELIISPFGKDSFQEFDESRSITELLEEATLHPLVPREVGSLESKCKERCKKIK